MATVFEQERKTDSGPAWPYMGRNVGWEVLLRATHAPRGDALLIVRTDKEMRQDLRLELTEHIARTLFVPSQWSTKYTVFESADTRPAIASFDAAIAENWQESLQGLWGVLTGDFEVGEQVETDVAIRLCDEDFDNLLVMLDEDRQPTKAMLQAFERFERMVGR